MSRGMVLGASVPLSAVRNLHGGDGWVRRQLVVREAGGKVFAGVRPVSFPSFYGGRVRL